jgi:hypothetical protein
MSFPLPLPLRLAAAGALLTMSWALAPAPGFVTFTDVTKAAGITFRHTNGAFGKKYLPETLGSGAAFLDVDNDGWQDILFVNSKNWPSQPGAKVYPALYRNNQNGTFTDITRQAGLAVEMYGMGAAAADYDNDGNVDVYVTGLGRNYLFRNTGGGKFVDVTDKAGVASAGFSTSAAWLDYDHDGRLDLFVAHYVDWSIEHDLFCTLDGKSKSYCTPESYKGQSPTLYHGRADGTFEDVTKKAGLYDATAKGLGVATFDYDGDGWTDLVVTNDTQPNRLYRNQKNGTFVDAGMTAGIAFNEAGVARAGMGVDTGDFDGSGHEGIVIGNFSNEMMTLYANDGKGLYIDEAPTSTIGKASLLTLTFACFFFDADLDGKLDIFAANGHVADDISRVQPKVTYAEPAHLFRNLGSRKFEEATAGAGPALMAPVVARGAAYADIDNDGDLDLLITTSNGPARLLKNGGSANHVLRIRTVGTASNRDGIGARVTVTVDKGTVRRATVKTGSSYLSQSELPLTFGLGAATGVTSIEVAWPSGRVDKVPATAADQVLTIQEGKGVIAQKAIRRSS